MKISDADPYELLYGSGSDFYFTNQDPQIRSGSSLQILREVVS